jgi:hypothetical protein
MTSRTELIQQQKTWAESVGLNPDSRGYVDNIGLNLISLGRIRCVPAVFNHSAIHLE